MRKHSIILILVLLFVATGNALAQHQRLGLSAQPTILLDPTGSRSVKEVEAFCLDRHLYAPSSPTLYKGVVSNSTVTVTVGNSAPVKLETAVAQGLIEVFGNMNGSFDSQLSVG